MPRPRLAKSIDPTQLSRRERIQVMQLIRSEMASRGTPLKTKQFKRTPWTTDPKGYYVRNDGKFYTPGSKKYENFIYSMARFTALIGGRGSGKTTAGIQRALKKIESGETGVIMTPDFEQFRFSTWPEICKWLPWDKVIREHRYRRLPSWEPKGAFTETFVNGAKIYFKGLKDPESARGPNINWLWYDEAGRDKTGLGWNIAIGGVRIGNLPSAWITTTPKGKRHWLHKLFVEQDFDRTVRDLLKELGWKGEIVDWYSVSIEDNKPNLDPFFYASMRAAYGSGWFAEQELEGKFVEPGGHLAERQWFKIEEAAPAYHDFDYLYRYWDLAATEKEQAKQDPDYTAGALVGWKDGTYWVLDVVYKQIRWKDIKDLIAQTAVIDGTYARIRFEQEGGAGGKNIVAELCAMKELIRYDRDGHRPAGDKVVRANPWFGQAKAGNVRFLRGAWNTYVLDEIEEFPDGDHDDTIDAISGAVSSMGLVNLGTMLNTVEVSNLPPNRWTPPGDGVVKTNRWRV